MQHQREISIPFSLIDAFTLGRSFTGNPAAVCVLPTQTTTPSLNTITTIDYSKPETIPKMTLPFCNNEPEIIKLTLQNIATEMQQSETVFVQRVISSENKTEEEEEDVTRRPPVFLIRWFSPTTEVMLCGHATMAASHCLFSQKFVPSSCKVIDYVSPSFSRGFTVFREEDDNDDASSSNSNNNNDNNNNLFYSLHFPNNKPHMVNFRDKNDYAYQVADAVCQSVRVVNNNRIKANHDDNAKNNTNNTNSMMMKIDNDKIKSMWYHTKSRKYIVEVDSPETIVNLQVNIPKLHSLLTREKVFSVTFTARNHQPIADEQQQQYEFQNPKHEIVAVSRHFAPWVGISEDPVTGAAHVVLGPMWVERILERSSSNNNKSQKKNADEKKKKNKFFSFFQAFPGRGGIIRLRVESDKVVTLNGTANTIVKGELRLTKEDVNGLVVVGNKRMQSKV